jgi:hypothetical protein
MFSATGSLVGTTLTLFPMYESSLGTSLPNPVILKVRLGAQPAGEPS